MTKQKLKIQKAPKAYKLDPEKFANAPQRVFALVMCDTMYFSEDYKYFDVIKPYLDIPPEPKSLEELQQELEDKFDVLIARTIGKFEYYKESADHRYNQFCKKQDGDFEYAKTQGYFPKLTIGTIGGTLGGSYLTTNSSGAASWSYGYGSTGAGYYQISPNTQFWMTERPNRLVRTCAKIFLGLVWKDA